jgi:hypothetical protein
MRAAIFHLLDRGLGRSPAAFVRFRHAGNVEPDSGEYFKALSASDSSVSLDRSRPAAYFEIARS